MLIASDWLGDSPAMGSLRRLALKPSTVVRVSGGGITSGWNGDRDTGGTTMKFPGRVAPGTVESKAEDRSQLAG